MGVVGSKRKYNVGDAKQGTGTDPRGQFDENAPGGPDDEKKDDEKKEETSASEEKMKNVNKWKPFLTAIVENKEAKDIFEEAILRDKANKEDEYVKKGMFIDKDVLKDFASGDGAYLFELMLYTGDVGLKQKEGNPLKLNTEEALQISTEESGRKGHIQKLNKEVKMKTKKSSQKKPATLFRN